MATVSFRLNHPTNKHGVEKSKPVAINVVYSHKSCTVELSTGQRVIPAKWTGSRVKGVERAESINKFLSKLENKLLNITTDHHDKTLEEQEVIARQIIKGGSFNLVAKPKEEEAGQKKTSLFTVGRFLVQCRRELDPKTVTRYRVVWRALANFMNGKRLDFTAFNMSFHDKFKNFLYDIPNPLYAGYHLEYDRVHGVFVVTPGDLPGSHIGLFDDTVFKYLIILQNICRWVEKRGYKVHPSYKEWKFIKRKYAHVFIDKDELEAIESLPQMGLMQIKKQRENKRVATLNINLDHIKDFISLLCRSGQRISDIRQFEAVQVFDDSWNFTQRKGNRTTVKTMSIPLRGFCSPIKMILEKYNYKLPKITEGALLAGIKEVAKRAQITKPIFIERWAGSKKIRIPGLKYEFLGTHAVGKKAFINILTDEGISTKAISDITGTSEKTIRQNYQARLAEETLIGYLEKVEPSKSVMKIAN